MESKTVKVTSSKGNGYSSGKIYVNGSSYHRAINAVVFSTTEAERLRRIVDSL